ncbi:MAG: PH domain-containing protein [Candidatus Woesebacteria bacterium]
MPEIFNSANTRVSNPQPKRRSRKENVTEAEKYSSILRTATGAGNVFSAYCPKPSGVTFDLQHDDEPVLLILRQHPIVNIPWILITLFLSIAPVIFLPLVPVLQFFPGRFGSLAILGWYTIVLGYALEQFLIWFFNIYIITDERIIDVDFYNLLFKKVSEAKIENIEDITTSNNGFLQSIVDYGDIRIQTAAEIPEIEFERVPHPDKVQKFLSEMIDQEEQEKIEGRVR